MKNRSISILILFILWLVLSWSFAVDEILAGLFFSMVTVIAAESLFGNEAKSERYAKYPWLAVYALMLAWDMLRACGDSLYRLALPSPSGKPRMLKVKTTLRDQTALAVLSGTIAYLPGTLAVGLNPERDSFSVYCAAGQTDSYASVIELSLFKYEKILKKVFE